VIRNAKKDKLEGSACFILKDIIVDVGKGK